MKQSQLKKLLKKLAQVPVEYPDELRKATRAKFLAQAKRKPRQVAAHLGGS